MSTSYPQFKNPELPAIKKFKLNYILKHELSEESNAVKQSVLEVSRRYRNDLKKEIKSKLSVEQKLQNKNIDLGKLIHSMEVSVSSHTKSIDRVMGGNGANVVDDHMNRLVDVTGRVSEKVESVAGRVKAADERMELGLWEKYPMLRGYFGGVEMGVEMGTPETPGSAASPRDIISTSPIADGPDSGTSSSPIGVGSGTVTTRSPTVTTRSPTFHQFTPTDDIEIDPTQFEHFMAKTLNSYRKLKQQKYASYDVFEPQAQPLSLLQPETENLYHEFDRSLSSTFHHPQNPISLLYVRPKPVKSPKESLISPNSSRIITPSKSPAIVTQSLQSSHFKKLRINGSPLTSTAKPSVDCECNPSPAKTVLVSLRDHAGPDTPGSSLFSSTDDEPDNEPDLSWESTNSDSSEDAFSQTNDYYKSLNSHNSHNKPKRKHLRRERQFSPTPKHQPSHHTLKPKGSILKPSHGVNNVRTKPKQTTPLPETPPVSEINSTTANGIMATGDKSRDKSLDYILRSIE